MSNEKWAIVIYNTWGSELFDFDVTKDVGGNVTCGDAIAAAEREAIEYVKFNLDYLKNELHDDTITWVSICSGPYDASIEEPEDAVNIETCDPIFVYESEGSDE